MEAAIKLKISYGRICEKIQKKYWSKNGCDQKWVYDVVKRRNKIRINGMDWEIRN